MLMNQSILCNCNIEAESNFLLESLAACEGPETKTDLEMHFTVNLAFMNYFKDLMEKSSMPISWNWTTEEQILPISLKTFEIDPKLINAPKTLRELVIQYKTKKNLLNKKEQELEKSETNDRFRSFLNSFLADVLIFTATLITLIITLIIMYMLYRQSKLKALVTNIAMQRIKAVEAADMSDMLCTQWYIMGMSIIITLGMLYLVTNKLRKTSFCKGHLFSNNTKILLFISNAHSYVPVKLCIMAGSIHLFWIKGRLTPENVKLKKNWIWDVLEIDWSDVSITLNDNEINLPRSMVIPFREKYRARKLLRKHPFLFYIMLKQGKMWFSLVPEPRNPSIAVDNNWKNIKQRYQTWCNNTKPFLILDNNGKIAKLPMQLRKWVFLMWLTRRHCASDFKSLNKNRKPHTGRGYWKADREILPMEETIQRRETISPKTSRSFNSQEKWY